MVGLTMQLVTVNTGKEVYFATGGMELKKYSGGETVTVPLYLAAQWKANGLVTY